MVPEIQSTIHAEQKIWSPYKEDCWREGPFRYTAVSLSGRFDQMWEELRPRSEQDRPDHARQ